MKKHGQSGKKKKGQSDDFQTPVDALEILLQYIKKEWLIWECASGNGNLVRGFEEQGYSVIGTDIKQGREFDFLAWSPPSFDCIITNPPFSIKGRFLKRCCKLGRPFALLMPFAALETTERQFYHREFGLQLLFFDHRIKFEVPKGMEDTSSMFPVAWFCYNLNLPKELNWPAEPKGQTKLTEV